jgi:RNA polymerase sigma-70 factor (ECF subfamily)
VLADGPALLARFRASRRAQDFSVLYRAESPRLYRIACRLLRNDLAAAADVLQETWLRALRQLDQFRGDSAFGTWLVSILIHCCQEWRRRQGLVVAYETTHQESIRLGHSTAPLDASEIPTATLLTALEQLADGYLAVLVLHDVEGYTHDEIAPMLGIDAGTSRSQLARARARMRQLLHDGTRVAVRTPGL